VTSTHPDSFVISLPEGWREVPLDPAGLVDAVREGASATLPPEMVDSLEFKHQLLVLRRLAQQMSAAGVVFAAAMSDAVTTDDADEPPLFLSAVMTLATFHAQSLGADTIRFEHLQRGASEAATSSGLELLAEPTVVELGDSPAVYVVGTQRVEDPNTGSSMLLLHCRYYVIIGEGDGMAALAFLTPNVEISDEFAELFYSVACGLEFTTA
jgi:hypothetical protein